MQKLRFLTSGDDQEHLETNHKSLRLPVMSQIVGMGMVYWNLHAKFHMEICLTLFSLVQFFV